MSDIDICSWQSIRIYETSWFLIVNCHWKGRPPVNYCTVLYCTVLYCTVLYYIVLYILQVPLQCSAIGLTQSTPVLPWIGLFWYLQVKTVLQWHGGWNDCLLFPTFTILPYYVRYSLDQALDLCKYPHFLVTPCMILYNGAENKTQNCWGMKKAPLTVDLPPWFEIFYFTKNRKKRSE